MLKQIKLLKNFKIVSLYNTIGRLRIDLKHFNAIFTVKGKGPLVGLLKSLAVLSSLRLSLRRVRSFYFLVQRLVKIYRDSGPKGLVLYLKACSILTQQALGGHIELDTAKAGKCRVSRTNSGFPRIIPKELRADIRSRNFFVIKLVLSIFALHRAITFPGKPDLTTISAPFRGSESALDGMKLFVPTFVSAFVWSKVTQEELLRRLRSYSKIFPIFKSAPGMVKQSLTSMMGKVPDIMSNNFSTSPVNVLHSIRALANQRPLFKAARDIAVFSNNEVLREIVRTAMQKGLLKASPFMEGPAPFKAQLGKLRAKEEPAGKVRIFAMVDPITQWVLYPFHKAIFYILRFWPMDGTFNQLEPLKRLQFGKGLYSVDLSAATDRLPMPIQVAIFAALFGSSEIAHAWSTLLVERSYSFFQLGYSAWSGVYRYAIGQPMGALSSWASLAITHHFIVQVAAWRSGIVPMGTIYTNYAVLGDDLVIGDKEVYKVYLAILEELGMPVNLSKSIISERGTALEFAKRTVYLGKDVSPITVKDMASAQTCLPAMVQFMKNHKLSFIQLLSGFGFGWRVKSSINKPLGKLNSQVRNLYLTINIPTTVEEARSFFALGAPNVVREAKLEKIPKMLYWTEVEHLRRQLMKLELYLVRMGSRIIFELPKAFAEFTLHVDHRLVIDRLHSICEKQMQTSEVLESWLSAVPRPTAFVVPVVDYYLRLTDFYRILADRLWKPYTKTLHLEVGRILDNLPSPRLDFFEMYVAMVKLLREQSLLGIHTFAVSRPEGAEGAESNIGLTPAQLRFYRRWSGVVQGVLPLDSLFVTSKRVAKPVDLIKGPKGINSFVMVNPNPSFNEFISHKFEI